MALPKLNDKPKYEIVIPSTQEKVRYRPYLVKEEKVLMLAMESQDQLQMFEAIADTIEACLEEPINKRTLTSFDVEYLFINIRSKSVGENIKITLPCEKCEHENELNIPLNDIVIEIPDIEKNIKLTDDISLNMKYPSYLDIMDVGISNDDASQTEITFRLILKCIESVITDDEQMLFKEEPEESQMEFIESLSNAQFESIREFIESMPQIKYDIDSECGACGHVNTVKLRGMSDFF